MLISGIGRRTVHKRTGGTGTKLSFSLPLLDAGAGAVNLVPMTALGNGTATFTRATAAWTKLSTGLWASVASGTARSSYLGLNTAIGSYGGYLAEGANTNSLLWSRDLTNAAWTKTTMTNALTATGIDGAVNSATTLTASAGNGTVTQAITLASNPKTLSFWIKRVTGTGAIQITLDNFATNTDVTALINSNTYTRVTMTQTLANPTLGIKIVTNTDAIAVDMAQLEDIQSFASTPIPTTTIAVARNADVLTYPSSGNISGTIGSLYFESAQLDWPGLQEGNNVGWFDFDSAGNRPAYQTGTQNFSIYDGVQDNTGLPLTGSATVQKFAASWGGVIKQTFLSGTMNSGNNTFDGDMNAGVNFLIGARGTGGSAAYGTIRNMRIYPVALSAAQLVAMTS